MDVSYGTRRPDEPPSAASAVGQPLRTMRRPNPAGPTIVSLGVNIQEIAEVDANAGSVAIAGYLDQIWCDPSLASDPSTAGAMRRLIGVEAADRLASMWRPDVGFVHALEPIRTDKLELLIHPDGTVESRSTFFAKIAMAFDLRAFPFDVQVLRVGMESFSWERDELLFMSRPDVVGFSKDLRIAEWGVGRISQQVTSRTEPRDGAEYSRVDATVGIRRAPGVYVAKVMVPLAVITLVTMVVFWLESAIFGSIGEMLSLRLGTSFTGLLTAVAYQFIVSGNVPRHVYNTCLDAFVGLSFLVIALSIGESVWIGYLCGREQSMRASRLDWLARWAFPLGYVSGIALLYAVYTR